MSSGCTIGEKSGCIFIDTRQQTQEQAMLSTLTSIFILVFSTPESDTLVAAFDTAEDCEEVAWTMERYLTGDAHFYCISEMEA